MPGIPGDGMLIGHLLCEPGPGNGHDGDRAYWGRFSVSRRRERGHTFAWRDLSFLSSQSCHACPSQLGSPLVWGRDK